MAMNYKPSTNELIILDVLMDNKALDEDSSLNVENLRKQCANEGLSDKQVLQMALMNLIDHDLIEYEMDENLQASEFWIIDAEAV